MLFRSIANLTTITSVVSSQMASNDSQSFQETKQKISIQDSDQAEASTALSSYLSKTNELIELKDYNTITIQDELYNRNTTNVILIPSGFEQFLVNGQITELLDVCGYLHFTQHPNFFGNKVVPLYNLVKRYEGNLQRYCTRHALDSGKRTC